MKQGLRQALMLSDTFKSHTHTHTHFHRMQSPKTFSTISILFAITFSDNAYAVIYYVFLNWKRLWCWERLRAREGDNREWGGGMASPTQWTWAWANSGRHGERWGAWCASVSGVTESQTQLSNSTAKNVYSYYRQN